MELQIDGLTTGGWIFLISAWTIISGMTGYCFYRVMKLK